MTADANITLVSGEEPDLGAAISRLCELQAAVLEELERLRRQLAGARSTDAPARLAVVEPIREQPAPSFRRDGGDWEIGFAGERFRLRDSKGLTYIAHLLACAGVEAHALDLIEARERPGASATSVRSGEGGELIDDRARGEYRRRLAELSDELDRARGFNDPERVARVRAEMDFLARELESTVGLHGRPRRNICDAERARQSVTKAIKAAQERIAETSPALARHLARTIQTGTFCSYTPPNGPRPADLPRGTVTMLFSDIEGSTRLMLALGEHRYAALLAEHQRTFRTVVRRHGGVVVGTQGDAFFVAFADAAGAVEAAAALQAIPADPIRFRIGIHTGEPQCLGDDYTGIDVHRTARICAAGHGGQILVSDRTRTLLAGVFELTPLGSHQLKDLGDRERLFQLGDAEFPPLRGVARVSP